jgi:ribonuclease J
LSSKSQITFYGGVHEIGGNKFLLEDKGTKIFLDFGMQMGKVNQYFAEFLNPRTCNCMGDLFEFQLLPKLDGIYRKDYAKHMSFGGDEDNGIDAVMLTHAHIDHCAYIHYIRPDIPIYCSEGTKLIMQGFQDTGSSEDYIIFEENFQIKKGKKGDITRCRGEESKYPRKMMIFEDNKKFNIDSIEVEPVTIDHSLPGVCGFIFHTSKGFVGYTADIRFHGRRSLETQRFVDLCGNSNIDLLLCEGTRIQEEFSKTELDVETEVSMIVSGTKNLVVCSYPTRDLDRLLSFYNAAVKSNRDLVIDLKQAYLLKLFQSSNHYRGIYPSPDDKRIKIYIPRKGWGLVDKDITYWSKKQLLADYENWADGFIDFSNHIDHRDVFKNQSDLIFFCSDFQLQELIDVRPKENSNYIRSSTEPFDDEMELDQRRVKRWLLHFGLITKDSQWNHIHVSGHGSGDQIKKVIEETKSKTLIPIHTEHEEYHKKWHPQVKEVQLNSSIIIG